MEPLILELLRDGVEQHPQNAPLRLFFAQTLLQAGEYTEALAQAYHLLSQSPNDPEALEIVAIASSASSEHDTSKSADTKEKSQSSPASALAPISASEVEATDIDELLREVLAEGKRHAVSLDDVGGLEEVKARLKSSFLNPMRNPELRHAYSKALTGGLLLYGPPGCGKTFVARAVAGELGASFMHIALHNVVEKWFGQSEQNLHRLFEVARQHAPCLVFFDELDALGYRRSSWDSSPHRSVLAQLLTEMDSATSSNEGIFFLAATNAPWDVDPALRRPGRFDRTVFVGPPDADARTAILELHAKDRPTGEIDYAAIAKVTDGFSGADLRLVIDTATELAMDDSMTSGEVIPITMDHLHRALRTIRPSIAPWIEMARGQLIDSTERADDFDELLTFLRKKGRRSIGFGG